MFQVCTRQRHRYEQGSRSCPDQNSLFLGRAYLTNSLDAPDSYQLVIEDVATGETRPRDLAADLFPVGWSPDGQYLFLDDGRGDSPIWRLPAGGRGELEAIIDDGYLLAIVDSW